MKHEANPQQAALARRNDLVIQELPDEVLVYDLKQHKAHCLNSAAAFVWNHCDGQTTAAEIATLMGQEWNKPISEDAVWLAFKQLDQAELLQVRPAKPETENRLSRRQVMRRLGVGAAATLPLVVSVIAPMAASAATVPPVCTNCTTREDGILPCPPVCGPTVLGSCYFNNSCNGVGSPLGCVTCQACGAAAGPPARSWRAGPLSSC
jgi:hypothetical protein